MLLLLQEAIVRGGRDDLMFFQTAYIWRFNKQVDISVDVLAYRTQQRVPSYVLEYLRHIYEL